jgi:hypothetical protein
MKKIILTSSHAFKTWNNLTLCEKDNINLTSGLQSLENSFCKATVYCIVVYGTFAQSCQPHEAWVWQPCETRAWIWHQTWLLACVFARIKVLGFTTHVRSKQIINKQTNQR